MRTSSFQFWVNLFRLLKGIITACDRMVREREFEDRHDKVETRKGEDSQL